MPSEPGMQRAQNAEVRRTRALLFGLVILLVLVIMFPFLWLLTMSFKTDADIFAWPPRLLFAPTVANYAALWEGNFPGSFANSAITSIVSTLLAMIAGVPGAYLELLDTRTGLIIIYLTFNISLVIWLMRSFFDATPRSLEEAAWIDGASLWQGFYKIILPLSGPGLAATAILCFLYSWNDFFFALILTRTEAMTAPVAVVNFMNYEGWEWGKIAAGGTMVMLPVLFFSILVRKFLVHGLTAGALKG
jgi:multiple sugar transport system permease protein